jgi:hypothetical protein
MLIVCVVMPVDGDAFSVSYKVFSSDGFENMHCCSLTARAVAHWMASPVQAKAVLQVPENELSPLHAKSPGFCAQNSPFGCVVVFVFVVVCPLIVTLVVVVVVHAPATVQEVVELSVLASLLVLPSGFVVVPLLVFSLVVTVGVPGAGGMH